MPPAARIPLLRWSSLAFSAGGLLMAALWIVYTSVHGPTSFDQTRIVLGRSTLFWGSLLSIPLGLLAALGWILLYPRLAGGARRLSRTGVALTLAGLLVPALADLLIWRALGPPFFVPVLGAGLILTAAGNRCSPLLPRSSLTLMLVIGSFQLFSFVLALIPLAVSNQISGYRIFGLFAYFFTGIGWMALGLSFWKAQTPA